jgi:coenzyme F420 biosynthesis associated uncharacterized protein
VPSATAPVLVIDRPGWIQANADAFKTIMEPLTTKAAAKIAATGRSGGQMQAVTARVSGAEVGALLSYLAPKILGQFDPFYPGAPDEPGGRLLLVAPNVVMVERELELDPSDFRLWVCLHEETHRVQFTAVPWMRDHIHGRIAALVESIEIEPGRLAGMLTDGLKRVGDLVRGDDEVSLLDLIQTPEQRAIVDQVTAVMSLLEGHADVVMDGVGPEVIGSVAEIRRKFNRRRTGGGTLDRVVRRLLGVDAKMAQYRNGAIFVRGVVDQVGMAGFNAVWTSPETLPSRAEIGDPEAWVRRVHG